MSKKMILTFMGITGFAAGHLPVFNTDQESVKTLIVSLRCASDFCVDSSKLGLPGCILEQHMWSDLLGCSLLGHM